MAEPSLDDVLSGNDVPAEEPSEEIKEETTPEPEKGEPEAKEETPKAEEKEAPPASAEDDTKIPANEFKGYLDEREKRQSAERELKDLRKQLEQAKPQEEPADPVQDPEGYQAQLLTQLRKERLEEQIEDQQELHSDFDDAWSWADKAINENPVLHHQLSGSRNLPRAVYKAYQDHLKLEQVGRLDDMEKEIETLKAENAALKEGKEVEAKTETEATNKAAEEKPSLANVATSQGSDTPGEVSLEDLLGADALSRPK